ncbi:MAG: Lrp/AsnC family transcriptional regulator [Candidatus Lokiarchaeota archaeon]|nr:Lrp/AsnC family transcriptional regulator [Candidatus Lokiarchaeota archaeon]
MAESALEQTLDIDDDDRKILSLVQNNASITQAEIATTINKIQPAVGARLLKLERKRLLTTQYGINLSATRIQMALVRMYTKHSKAVLKSIECCPNVLNAFTTLGRTNVTVILAGSSIEKLEDIVEHHFRSDPDIKHVEMAIVIEPVTETILPVDLNIETHDAMKCGGACHAKAARRAGGARYEPAAKGKLDPVLRGVDAKDKQIIMSLQDDPEATQEELGQATKLSQPAVGARIAKLQKAGVLGIRKGVNFKAVGRLGFVQAAIATSDVAGMVQKLRACPNISLGFHVVSETSIVAYIGGNSLDEVEEVIDTCIRADDRVKYVETIPVISYLKDLVLPLNFEGDFTPGLGCAGCSACTARIPKELAEIATRLPAQKAARAG